MSRFLALPLALVLALFTVGCAGEAGPSAAEPLSSASTPAAQADCDEGDGGLTLPDGFCASVVAEGVGPARHLAVRANGDLYVALSQAQDGHALVALRDTTGDGRADLLQRFGGDTGGTGIGLRGDHLYASTDQAVRRYALGDGDLVPGGAAETIASGFPEQGQHAAKSFAFDDRGGLYVNVGAPSNACQEEARSKGSPGQEPCPQLDRHGGVWRFAADRPGQTQQADGQRYVTGVRNAVALEWNEAASELYLVQHGRDQLHALWPERYTQQESAELPAEELMRATEGADLGWPYCYYDWQQDQKVLAPEYGGDGTEVGRCADVAKPVAAFPGHWAPNGLAFYTADRFPAAYRGGAFIAFHGSWNRAPLPQQGYKVVFVPFEEGRPVGEDEWTTFADGFAGAESLESSGNAEHRPMGLAVGPDGALYISDSREGRIWRVVPSGEQRS